MFCAPRLIFGGTEGVGSLFHILREQNRFRLNRGRQLPFLCFVLPDSFFAVMRASAPVFKFCAPGIIFDGTEGIRSRFHVCTLGHVFGDREGVGSRFHVLRTRNRFSAVPRVLVSVYMFCAPEVVSRGTEGVRSRFHVLRDRTGFRRYRGRRLQFSCFVFPNSFFTVTRASTLVFMFCAP
jgi:hypothetical protein